MMRGNFALAVAAASLLAATIIVPAHAGELAGRVIALDDGDSFTLIGPDNKEIRVRLEGIDAPESGQIWGTRSKQILSSFILAKEVRIVTSGRDQYGRTLGRVYAAGTDVNAEMVRSGAAWAYRQYLTDASLIQIEQQAKTARRGLWALSPDETMPPWEWRRSAPAPVSSPPQSSAQCAAKRYCREMSSCAEAQFYLNSCGVRRLDGDHDGTACDAMCKR